MDPLTIGAAGMALKGMTGLVRELRQSRAQKQAFRDMMRTELSKNEPKAAQRKQIEAASREFIRVRDANGDGALNSQESGLKQKQFNEIDTDRDGRMSLDEVRRYMAAQSKAE